VLIAGVSWMWGHVKIPFGGTGQVGFIDTGFISLKRSSQGLGRAEGGRQWPRIGSAARLER